MNESEVFRQKYEHIHHVLESAGADTGKLTIQLYSHSIIGKGVRDAVCEATTPTKAATTLLKAVETRIELHPQDIWTFVGLFSSFCTWEDLAEDMKQALTEIESKLTQPQPASDDTLSSSISPQQPLNIRLFISPHTGGSAIHPMPEQRKQSKERMVLRSAPPHRRQVQPTPPPLSLSKPFPQASSPSSSRDLTSPDQQSCTPSTVRESTDDPTSDKCLSVLRSYSTTSQSSIFEEEVGSMKESLEGLLEKHCRLKDKLHEKDREAKALQEELSMKKAEHETEMAAADQERKILKGELKTLKCTNEAMKGEVESARKSVEASNLLNQQLMERHRQCYAELKQFQDHCSVLEEKLKEATKNINFLEEYQKSEERAKELEVEVVSCKQTIIKLTDKIELLEMEIEIFADRTSLGSFGTDIEQEISGGFDSL